MATETRYADSNTTVSAGCVNVTNAYGAPNGVYTGNTDHVNWTELFGIGNPTNPLTSGATDHAVTVTLRKSASGGNGNPTCAVSLYDNGTLVRTLQAAVGIGDATTSLGPYTFTTAEVSNAANVQVQIDVVGQGGSPAGRRNVQVDGITVAFNTSVATQNEVGSVNLSGSGTLGVAGTPAVSGAAALSGSGSLTASGVPGSAPSGPTFVSYTVSPSPSVDATSKTTAGFDVQTGDLIVVLHAVEAGTNQYSGGTSGLTSSAGGAITWTQRHTFGNTPDTTKVGVWTGVADSNRTGMTVTVTLSTGVLAHVIAVMVFRNAAYGASNIANSGTSTGLPAVTLTTTAANSMLAVINADWTAQVTTPTYRQINGLNPASHGQYGTNGVDYAVTLSRYTDTGPIASVTAGETAPTAQRYVIAAVEVVGTGGGGSAYTGSAALSGSGTLTVPAGIPSLSRSLPLTGSGTLGATAFAAVTGQLGLSGSGTLSLARGPITVSGSTQLSGSGSLTAVGSSLSVARTAALSGSGSLQATGVPSAGGAGLLSGSGSLTASGSPRLAAAVSLAGSGTLTTSGSPHLLRSVSLSGDGTLRMFPAVRLVPFNSTDDFSTDLGWNTHLSSATVSGGVLVMLTTAPSAWGYATSPYAFTGDGQVTIEIDGPTTDLSLWTNFALTGTTKVNPEWWFAGNGMGLRLDAGVVRAHDPFSGQVVPYAAADVRFIRWQRIGSFCRLLLSPDGAAWTVVHEQASTFSPTEAVYLDLYAETTATLPESITVDNVVAEPITVPTAAFSGSGSLGATAQPFGSAALSGAGSLSATSVLSVSDAVALSGEGSLASTATVAVSGATAFTGDGALTVAVDLTTIVGSVSLSGDGVLYATGTNEFVGSVALQGDGALQATGVPATAGTGVLSGAGVLTAAGVPAPVAAVSLSGEGSLVPAGLPAYTEELDLTGSGTLTATGVVAYVQELQLTGDGSLLAAPDRVDLTGTVALSGEGLLAPVGAPEPVSTVALSGDGSLTAAGYPSTITSLQLAGDGGLAGLGTSVDVVGDAQLSGDGLLVALGANQGVGSVDLSGDGSLSSTGDTVISVVGAATTNGTGSLAANFVIGARGDAALAGLGALSVQTGTFVHVGSVELTGAGGLLAAGYPAVAATVGLSGEGSLVPAPLLAYADEIDLTGEGSLGQVGRPGFVVSRALSGSGSLQITATPGTAGVATFAGSGVLSGAGVAKHVGVAGLSGDGVLAADVRVGVGYAAGLSGVGVLTLDGGPVLPARDITISGVARRGWAGDVRARVAAALRERSLGGEVRGSWSGDGRRAWAGGSHK